MDRVVFSIDQWSDLFKLARFLRHMADCQALGKLKGEFKILQGSYKGTPEVSFMCSLQDYEAFVKPFGYTKEQETILIIDDKHKAWLKFLNATDEYLGRWTQVTKWEKGEDWTYDPKDNSWWTCI